MSVSPSPLIDPMHQEYIDIDLVYYDEEEKKAFEANYPPDVVERIDSLMRTSMRISTADFLQFYMLHLLDSGLPGFCTVDALRANIVQATQWIGPFLVFGNGSIHIPQGATLPPHVIERIGEAIGLCVASASHQVTHADWAKIPVRRHPANRTLVPSFDFAQASDGRHLLQVETKGAQCDDSRNKEPIVSKHRASIRQKKAAFTDRSDGQIDPFPSPIRYGTVTSIDDRKDGRVLCRLVDPDPLDPGISARDFKLLARMAFLSRWISLVSPQSQLATALANRFSALRALANPYALNLVPLLRADGEKFTFARLSHGDDEHSSFFAAKSRVGGGAAGGVGFQIKYGRDGAQIAFVGIREKLLDLAIEQDFEALVDYSAPTGIVDKVVEFLFSPTRFNELRLPPAFAQGITSAGIYKKFKVPGPLHYSSSGLVFGWFPL